MYNTELFHDLTTVSVNINRGVAAMLGVRSSLCLSVTF